MRRSNNIQNHARVRVGLILMLISLMSAAILVLSPARLVSAQAAAPSWSYTGSLKIPRAFHTATLLPNGKVLVAGGNGTELSSAELWDPATGAWSITGSPNVARSGHTATLLPNGKVLIAGGYVGNTAEVYDPVTEAWSFTANLNVSRSGHTATLLSNGKVLVVGGEDTYPAVISAELYDPTSGTWSVTGSLHPGSHLVHTATLLQNGKVLVVRGGDDDYLATDPMGAELYDPNTETWSITGNPNASRLRETATLLQNGNVLVAAGWGFPCTVNYCYSTVNDSAELYNPATGTWTYTGSLSRRDAYAATLLPNGQVLAVGGADVAYDNIGHAKFLSSAEVYDPATGKWNATASLNATRYFHTATLLQNGKVLIVGGFDGGSAGALRTAELYDSGAISTPNAIDDAQFFVRQHYRDFLNREPDADGLAFWTNEITLCGADQQCVEPKRINVSAAYFLSIEFQETGYLVYRMYKAAFGNLPNAPVPITLNEFLPDTREIGQGVIVNQAGWQQTLENNKQVFTAEFVQRSRFTSAYPQSMTAADFVDKLNTNAAGPLSPAEHDQLIRDLEAGAKTRAEVLRAMAENKQLAQQEFNRAFVLMQYFGYLRRNPNDAPDANFDGYNFWLNKLNQFNGNYIDAEMVKAFIISTEYRQRFGQP